MGTGGNGSSSLIPNEKKSKEKPRSRRIVACPKLFSRPLLTQLLVQSGSSLLPGGPAGIVQGLSARGSTMFSAKSRAEASEMFDEHEMKIPEKIIEKLTV